MTNDQEVARQRDWLTEGELGNVEEMSSGLSSYHSKHQVGGRFSPLCPHSSSLSPTDTSAKTHPTNVTRSGTSLVKGCWVSWCFCRVLLAPRLSATRSATSLDFCAWSNGHADGEVTLRVEMDSCPPASDSTWYSCWQHSHSHNVSN